MSEENLKRINITIAGRRFPVKVKPEEEAILKEIEKKVNDKVNEFQISYKGRDMQDYLSLILISYAFELHKAKYPPEGNTLEKKLDHIEALLSQ